jgi:hypothetical protein
MSLSIILALLQDAPAQPSPNATGIVKIISGVMALILVGVIIFRRKGSSKKDKEEEF